MKKRYISFLISICLVLAACSPAPAVEPQSVQINPTQTPQPAASVTPTVPAPLPTETLEPGPVLVWKYATGGAVWGSPTLEGSRMYIGSDDFNLYALDVSSGDLQWKFATAGFVRSQPAVTSDQVFFSSDDGFLYALDRATGNLLWQTDIGNNTSEERRAEIGASTNPLGYDYLQSSPVVVSDRVFVGSADGIVYAVDAETGDVVWTFLTGGAVRAKPVVSEGVVYVGSWDKNFYAIDALTGEEIWQTPLSGQVQSTGFVANGMVYTASRKASVFALDLQTGEIRWERSFGNNLWVESSPHLVGDTIYIGSSGSLKVEAIDSMTGKPKSLFMSRTFNWSTPVVVEDMLYIGAVNFELPERSGLLAIPLVDGIFPTATQWTWLYPMQATLAAGGGWSGVSGSPVVVNGIIYFGGLDGILYALKI